MNVRVKTIIIAIIDVALAAYLFCAITVFNRTDDDNQLCAAVDVQIQDDVVDGFLDNSEIVRLMKQQKIYPVSQPMSKVDVRKIENVLEKSPFIDSVECFKTIDAGVVVKLTQRMPLIRVKSNSGEDYYIDNRGGIMPNNRYAGDLVIATGDISKAYASKVLRQVGNYIVNSTLWHNQVEQLHVLPDGSIEMVPRVGDHIVYLGAPVDIPAKLERLDKFYRYGLKEAGWNKYEMINVEFSNQIICKKRHKKSRAAAPAAVAQPVPPQPAATTAEQPAAAAQKQLAPATPSAAKRGVSNTQKSEKPLKAVAGKKENKKKTS